jgi:hypothetical protein
VDASTSGPYPMEDFSIIGVEEGRKYDGAVGGGGG